MLAFKSGKFFCNRDTASISIVWFFCSVKRPAVTMVEPCASVGVALMATGLGMMPLFPFKEGEKQDASYSVWKTMLAAFRL